MGWLESRERARARARLDWLRRGACLVGACLLFGQTPGTDDSEALAVVPASHGGALEDWQGRFVAARDPHAAIADIAVEIRASLAVPGGWQVRVREHIANAEQPFMLQADGVELRRGVAAEFDGDVWAEALAHPDPDELAVPFAGFGAEEAVDVLEVPEHGLRLALYQVVSHGEVVGPAVRYLRAQTSADISGADVALTLPMGWPAVSPPGF